MAILFESCAEDGESSVSVELSERLRLDNSVVFNKNNTLQYIV